MTSSISEQRAAVVEEAMTWLRTPYHPQARVKGLNGGVDCVTLLTEVYSRAGVVGDIVLPHYPPDWHLHKKAEVYLRGILEYARELDPCEDALPGDIVMGRFGLALSHAAIISGNGWPQVIHADMFVGCVCLGDARLGVNAPSRRFSPWSSGA